MPAIDLTKLRNQAHELVKQASKPEQFIKSLEELFEYYKNYSLRVDKNYSGLKLPRYNTPKQVLATIEKELGNFLSNSPNLGLELATSLWNEPYLETKLMAVSLIRSIPSSDAIQVLTRIPEMSKDILEQDIFLPKLTNALVQIRRDNPNGFTKMLTSWLTTSDPAAHHWGLLTITNLVEKPDDKDLPTIFELLKSLLWTNDPSTRKDLVQCIRSLYSISPSETEYFLVESLEDTKDEGSLKNFSRLSRELPVDLFKKIKPILETKISSFQNQK